MSLTPANLLSAARAAFPSLTWEEVEPCYNAGRLHPLSVYTYFTSCERLCLSVASLSAQEAPAPHLCVAARPGAAQAHRCGLYTLAYVPVGLEVAALRGGVLEVAARLEAALRGHGWVLAAHKVGRCAGAEGGHMGVVEALRALIEEVEA